MSFENIIGYKNVRNRFDSFLSQLNDREKFAARGIAVPNGFLLAGVEGLGKEFMADTFYKETGREGYLFSGNGSSEGIHEVRIPKRTQNANRKTCCRSMAEV